MDACEGGAAMRRRQRRLRSWWRHEQDGRQMQLWQQLFTTLRNVLSRRSRSGKMLGTSPHGARRLTPELMVGCGQHFSLSRTWGDRVQWHIVEQTVVSAPGLQILNVPMLTALDSFVPEQVIEVPKISTPLRCPRTVLSVPQTAEQLVEVPTVLSPTRIASRIAEQIVDTPVPRGRDRRRLQGSLPRQSSTAAGVQNVDISVRGGLRGFLPGQSSAQRTVEQLVDSSSGGLQDFHLGQGSAASSSGRENEAFSGFFFALFPGPKKVRRYVLAPGRNWPRTRAHPRRALMAW